MLSVSDQPAMASTGKRPLSGHLLAAPQGRRLVGSLKDIMREVAAKHGMAPEQLLNACRKKPVALARNEFYYRALAETERPITVIGMICRRNHASVVSGAWRHTLLKGLPPARKSRSHWKRFKRGA